MIYLCKIVGMPFLKIGYSENFEKRIYWLNSAMPFEVECLAERNGSLSLEKDIHKICRDYLLKNEWYPDVDFIREAFFKVYDRFPGLDQMELRKTQTRLKHEHAMAFGPYKFNCYGEAVRV